MSTFLKWHLAQYTADTCHANNPPTLEELLGERTIQVHVEESDELFAANIRTLFETHLAWCEPPRKGRPARAPTEGWDGSLPLPRITWDDTCEFPWEQNLPTTTKEER